MGRMTSWLGVLAALLAGLLVFVGIDRALVRANSVQLFGGIVSRAETTKPLVALTFDDGPRLDDLDDILETLARREVRATFFVTGSRLAAQPEAGHRLVTAGHELGNHSWSHERMVLKSASFVRREVEETDALIRSAGHRGEIYFRPPYGHKFLMLPWYLWRTGRTTVTWDIEPDSYPEVASSASSIVAHVRERVRPGSIVLLHPWSRARRTSRSALPDLIDEVEKQGLRFVTLSELLRVTRSTGLGD